MEIHSETLRRRRGKFRRISRTRILDGHALKISGYAVTVMAVAYVCVTAAISILFSHFHAADFTMVLWAIPPGALLGYALLVMERLLGQLKEYLFPVMGKLLTAFLLFFAHAIGYLTLSSLIVSYPLAYVMAAFLGMAGLAGKYSLFSVNFFIILAVLSWLRNVRTPPCRCL